MLLLDTLNKVFDSLPEGAWLKSEEKCRSTMFFLASQKIPASIVVDECTDSGIIKRIGCILTYGGAWTDIGINYSLLALNLVSCWTTTTRLVGSTTKSRSGALSFVFVSCFQVGLCFIVGCSGISIIWCACLGWELHQRRRCKVTDDDEENATSGLRTFIQKNPISSVVFALDSVGILYYFFTTELITTIAHGCAIVLGALLSSLSFRSQPSTEDHPDDGSSYSSVRETLLSSQG